MVLTVALTDQVLINLPAFQARCLSYGGRFSLIHSAPNV